MSSTFVTLAEVLEARGGPLEEDEVWSLLLTSAESLLDFFSIGHSNICSIISPTSMLLSVNGTLAFKNCTVTDEVCAFTAPEMLQGRAISTRMAMEKMIVYSLGMTLYWSVDYHIPQNQVDQPPLKDNTEQLGGRSLMVRERLRDDEFFFLNHETKISKVAPDCWKKLSTSSFTLFLRVKFFADNVSYILHKHTRHQYYIQLRRDILEGRVYCNEDTAMFLAALALQAEFGDYIPEVYGKNYFQMEHYIPKRVMEKIALPSLRDELPALHANNANMLQEDAEIEFLKTVQQLPEYGVLFHRAAREKKLAIGELILGVCAKGIMVYEVKNNCRILIRRFQWSETDSISTSWQKFTVESGPSGKKHSFVTESSKIAQYLLDLCSAQHKFHSEMTSRQLTYSSASDGNKVKHPLIWRAQQNLLKRMSCSEVGLNNVGLDMSSMNSISKSCDDLPAKIQQSRDVQETHDIAGIRGLSELKKSSQSYSSPEPFNSPIYRIMSNVSLQRQDSESFSVSSRGFIIVGEDNTGKLDLGIFIASIIPDGPADKDGRIRPGGRLISLNKTSLEGVTFSAAAAILQNSPDEVELIVSQPKYEFRDRKCSLTASNLGLMLERGFDSRITQNAEHRTVKEDTEYNTATPKMGKKLHIPVVRILDSKDVFSGPPPKSSLRPGDLVCVELKKVNGSLGICVAVVSLLLEREPSLVMETLSSSSTLERQKSPSSLSAQSGTTPTGKDITMETPLSVRTKEYSFVSDENTMEVTLEKKLSGLGFSFLISDISPEEGSVVRIRRLFQHLPPSTGQSSEESNQLKEGDVILMINGESVKGLSYQKVLQLLRGTPTVLKLLICRPAPEQLPKMDSISLSPSPMASKKQRSRSLDLPVEYVSPDFSEVLLQKTTAPCQRKDSASPKLNTVQLIQQRQDSEQDETPSTLSSPPSPPSIDGQQAEYPADGVPSSICSQTPPMLTTLNPVQTPLMQTPSPTCLNPKPEVKEDTSSKSNHSSATTSELIEDLSGNRTHFMANGLDVLADEEYLTITTTTSTSSLIPRYPLPLPPTPPLRTSPSKTVKSPPPLVLPTSTSTKNGWDNEEEDEDEEPRREVFKEFELTVTLTKSRNGSFGFTITRSKLDNCYYIQEILDNPAKADGRLRPGDRLKMVNGHYVTKVSDEVAMTILRYSPKKLHMVLGRAEQNLLPPPPPDSLQDIIIYKTSSGQMGIKLRGGIGSKWQGIYVQEVVPNSPASEEGSIQPNDRIVYISGRCTLGMSLEDAVKICEYSSQKVKLKAMRDDQPVIPKSKWNGFFDWKKEKRFVPHSEEPRSSEVEAATDVKLAENEGFGPMPSVTSQQESCILQLEFAKPERGGLGFSLDSGNCTPTFKGCCPSLSVTDMLQSRADPEKQNLENSGTNIEKNHTDTWSTDDDDEDDDSSQYSSTETTPHTGTPIVSEEELTRLALISPSMNGQYSGSRLKSLMQNLQNQLDHHDLVKEFMALGHLTPSDNCLVGKAPENREKNRYREILPYDKTRVPVGEKQDYINASYIRMKVGPDEFFYISSQGPLPNTQDCFWQMVWESKSDIIAMMTREVERGKIKCHKYWPEKCDVPIETNHYQLTLDNYQKLDYFHIKVIKMVEKETGATHFVKHLKFTTWPDHSTPRCSKELVHFIRYMRAVHMNGPITVHCSAGIGRAGVLICTDVILGLIERDLTINVSEIVREMRLQRHGMIQTKEQYVFCYKVWLDVLQSISLLHGNQWQSETPL
ncbi:tyrosine-protein phosphatase non-receptor type 13-like isoform X1 [Clarias magur]|uniref:Tyrosine-protein phosphatase non-receptor type 13-like isoform X1 n=1 Tax=Clarias magur TaxID=1594786 RepID=A0A8J5C9X5_CLAMG|nr:tyrosine-protein phosphatase non-receptor type 13-like isoform X1 [Clarias magur]